MSVYSQFLAGSLHLSVPSLASMQENVNRFLVSNGVIAEGASREQVESKLRDSQSFFESVRGPDETLSQTILRFRGCLIGVGWTRGIQKIRDHLESLAAPDVPSPFLWRRQHFRFAVPDILFGGGMQVFDDDGERAEALIDEIMEARKDAKASMRLRRLASKVPRARLGERAANVWLVLIEALEADVLRKRRIQRNHFEGITRCISETPLGERTPQILRALCAQIDRIAPSPVHRSRYLCDVAAAANRLGRPDIAEILLDEIRAIGARHDRGTGKYRAFKEIIEELQDPERMMRQYFKWLPSGEDLEASETYICSMAGSLARTTLGPRIREIVTALTHRVEEELKRSDDLLLRFRICKDLAYSLRTLGLGNESLAYWDRAYDELQQVKDPVQREKEIRFLKKPLSHTPPAADEAFVENPRKGAHLARIVKSLASLGDHEVRAALLRNVLEKHEAFLAADLWHSGQGVLAALEADSWDDESRNRIVKHKESVQQKEKSRNYFKEVLHRAKELEPEPYEEVLRGWLISLREVSDPLERSLLQAHLFQALLWMSFERSRKYRRHMGHLMELALEEIPSVQHGTLRAKAVSAAFNALVQLRMKEEEKQDLFGRLTKAVREIPDSDRRAGALLRMADVIAFFQMERNLPNQAAIAWLHRLMEATAEIPAEHPAASFVVREIGRQLAERGVESGYPREALTLLDEEFLRDPPFQS